MSADLASGSLESGLFAASTVARCPCSQDAEAARHALPQQSHFGVLSQLLGILQRAYPSIEVAERHLGVGINLLPVPLRKVDMLRRRGARGSSAQMRFSWGSC